MKVACCQLNIVWENKHANREKVWRMMEEVSLPAGSLIILPELFSTGFSMNVAAVCDSSPSETESFLKSLAQKHQSYVIAGAGVSSADGLTHNQALTISPQGAILQRYNKIHPFSLISEAHYYAAGTQLVLFEWNGAQVAPLICYDLRFPELFRAAVRRGAQIFPVIANWPIKREMHWVTLLQARAIENQAYVLGVNRCGNDPKYTYSGRSLIVDPHGQILADAGHEEGVITADLDLGALNEWRREFPALADMHWKE